MKKKIDQVEINRSHFRTAVVLGIQNSFHLGFLFSFSNHNLIDNALLFTQH